MAASDFDQVQAARFAKMALDWRSQGVPQQNRPFFKLRRRRETAARIDSGVFRVLRLALFCPWPLATGAVDPPVPCSSIRG